MQTETTAQAETTQTETALTEFQYNRTRNGDPCKGVVRMYADRLTCLEAGAAVCTLRFADVADFSLRAENGGVAVEYTEAAAPAAEAPIPAAETPTPATEAPTPAAETTPDSAGTPDAATPRVRVLCRAGMEHRNRLTAVVRMLRIYKRTGEFQENYRKEGAHVCPRCGRILPGRQSVCLKCVSVRSIVKRFLQLAAPYKKYLLLSALFFLLSVGIGLIGPYVSKILVDSYINSEHARALALSAPEQILAGFLGVLFALFGVYVLNYAVNVVRNLTVMQATVRISVRLRDMVFGKIQSMSLSKISQRTAGELIQRVNNDTAQVQDFIAGQMPNVLGQLFLLLGVGMLMFFYDWRLFLIVVLPMPVAVLAMRAFHRVTRRIYGQQWQAESRAGNILFDIFSGIRVVKAYGTEARESERYGAAAAQERDIGMRNEVFYAKASPFIRFSLTLGTYFLMYYTGSRILSRQMTIGEATMFTSYVSLIYGPIGWLTNIPGVLARAFTSMVRLFDVLDEKEDLTDREAAASFPIEGRITFDRVTFGYDKTADVLKDVSFEIRPGEMIGLVGRSGVGKSTLINLVMRLYDVTEGAIRIDGVDIRDIAQESLRSQIGVVLQETFLFAGSVYENLLYAKPDATREEIIGAAKIAGAHEFICKMPQGYNTRVGERGQMLSGGERQRIAIARAILRNPRILILDEATASLDTEVEKQIQDTLQRLSAERTTIAIAHRLSTLRNANRIVVLDKGTVAEIGTHEELLEKRGIYYGLVMAQRSMSRMDGK